MVKVKDHLGKEFAMDGWLTQNLDLIKKILRNDLDCLILLSGKEGSGKSVLANQCARYVDHTFTEDRMCINAEEFTEKIINANKYQAVVYDEAMEGLSATDSMTKTTKALVKLFAEIRQKNLFVIVVLPSFFDLNKNIALHRSRALIHVYMDGFKRGQFLFFNDDKKKNLYIKGKKFMDYKAERSNFYGKFVNHYCIDEEAYREKKAETLKRYRKEMDADEKRQENKGDLKYKDIAGWAIELLYRRSRVKLKELWQRLQQDTQLSIPERSFTQIRTDYIDRYETRRFDELTINNTTTLRAAQNNKEDTS